MAQALPRFCPQCGTPTRPDISHCAICGLPAEAMLRRSSARDFRTGENLSQPDQAEPAHVASPGRQTQERSFSPFPGVPDNIPNQSGSSQPSQQGGQEWATQAVPGTSDIEDMPTRIEPAFSPFPPTRQPPWSNRSEQEEMATQPADAFPPPQPPRSNNPSSQDNRGNQPAGAQAPWNNNPSSQENWGNQPASPQSPWNNNPSSQENWGNQPASPQSPWSNNPPSSPSQENWGNNQQARSASSAPSWATGNSSPVAAGAVPRTAGGKRRLTVVILLLVALLVLGAGGYFAFSALSGGHGGNLLNQQSTIKTTSANSTITYAGIDITLQSIQQAQNFTDDPQSANNGMLRLKLQEQNKTSVPLTWNYMNIARLLVPGKAGIAPGYVQSKGSLAPGATASSTIDFPVLNGGDLNKLSLQLGASGEATMLIPLAGQANLAQYQPKTEDQKGDTTYFGLNWTLTSSTTSFSLPGQQASTGMEFLTLTLKVDNPLSQQAISGSPFDYLKVKIGDKTMDLVSTTLPVSFAVNDTGKTGTATFLIPQNSQDCTLLFLSQDPGDTTGQATIDFHLG